MPGLFVTFEGPEGSGKSTHATDLAERLCGMEFDVVRAREPGGTPTGEAIRDILQHDAAGEPVTREAELLLFAASRAQLVQDVIKPALARGAIVICDRFADSTTAYQGYGRERDVECVLNLNEWATGGLVPDVTLLLDLDVAVGFERIHKRNQKLGQTEDPFEREDRAFHERVRAGYLALAQRWPERFRVIQSEAQFEDVSVAIWGVIESLLPSAGCERRPYEG